MNEKLFLGIDNGLTRIKTAIYSTDGNLLRSAYSPTRVTMEKGGKSEINMHEQWNGTISAIRSLFEDDQFSPNDIQCIGVSGFGNGLFALNAQGEVFQPAISSMDYRAEESLKALPIAEKEELTRLSLQKTWTGQTASILYWLKQHQPEVYASISTVFFCKDWIRYCLTGEISSDITDISASGLYNVRTKKYDDVIFNLLNISDIKNALPQIRSAYDIAGTLSKETALITGLVAGTPVISGAFDVASNALGSGLSEAGQFCTIMGTWNIGIGISDQPVQPEHIRQTILYADPQKYALVDSSATSTANLEWFLGNILHKPQNYTLFDQSIADTAQENEIIFTPFINCGLGSDNPGCSIHNLRNYHEDTDVLRAIAEGILFAHRYHIENIQQEGLKLDSICVTGGGSKNPNWCQMLADILQTEVILPQSEETGILGNCILAATGIGCYANIDESIRAMTKIRHQFTPNANKHDYYKQKYEIFKKYIA